MYSLLLLFILDYEKQMYDVCSFFQGEISNINEIQIMFKQIIKKLKFMILNNFWYGNDLFDVFEDNVYLRRNSRYFEKRKRVFELYIFEILRCGFRKVLEYR